LRPFTFLIARAGLTPRILDRPEDDIWSDADIRAVNHFHNAVVGTEEFLRFPTDRIAVVERGLPDDPSSWTAVVMVNLGYETNIDTETKLVDGEYRNEASSPCSLTVSQGKLRGSLPGGVIFVSYPREDTGADGETVFRAKYDVGWGHSLFIRGNEPPLSWSEGVRLQWTEGNVWEWKTNEFAANEDIEFKVLINDKIWEIVDSHPYKNHRTKGGETQEIVPVFP